MDEVPLQLCADHVRFLVGNAGESGYRPTECRIRPVLSGFPNLEYQVAGRVVELGLRFSLADPPGVASVSALIFGARSLSSLYMLPLANDGTATLKTDF